MSRNKNDRGNRSNINPVDEVKNQEIVNVVDEIQTETETVDSTESIEEETKSTIINGVVTGCSKLNVRKEPSIDSEIITEINKGEEIKINLKRSTDDFYSAHTRKGFSGFVMKKFIVAE